jgi:Flp pilus assembly protein TadD
MGLALVPISDLSMSDALHLNLETPEGIASAFLEHGVTPADIRGMTEEELEAVYAEACDRIEAEEFSQALDLTVFLVTHQPWDRRFHFVFALCLQHLGDYESAARHYSQAYTLDATDAGCAYRIGECLEALGQMEEAREAYKAALDLSFGGQGLPELRDAAQARLDFINSQPS